MAKYRSAPLQDPGAADNARQRSLRERFGALRNMRPFLREIWGTSKPLTLASFGLRLVRALLPIATLYVGKLIIDEAVRLVRRCRPRAASASGGQAASSTTCSGCCCSSSGWRRSPTCSDGWSASRRAAHPSCSPTRPASRLMEHAATLDLEDFEDADLQDKLDRARRQTMGRMTLMSQLFGQAQDLDHRGQLRGRPAGLRAVADRAAGDRAGAGLRRRGALQRAQLLAELPVDAGAAPARIPAPDRRERRDGERGQDLRPQSLLHRPLRELSDRFYDANRKLAIRPRAVWGTLLAMLGTARLLRRLRLHRVAHGAAASSASAT